MIELAQESRFSLYTLLAYYVGRYTQKLEGFHYYATAEE